MQSACGCLRALRNVVASRGLAMTDRLEHLTIEDIDAASGTMLPSKEVMSLLDLNLNVDLGLDLAAPIDLAVAANLNVAAPIEAAVSSNVLSLNSDAIGLTKQGVLLDQTMSGNAIADAPQQAGIDQSAHALDAAPAATSA